MAITRYHSWQPARYVHNDMRQAFDRFFGEEQGDQSDVVTSQWAPHVDIKEEDQRFIIYADIPGVDPKDIEVNMDKGILTLKGERTSESSDASDKFTRVERSHGVFYRRFALPDSADADGISATGKLGVLEISIPKKAETTPRRININSAE